MVDKWVHRTGEPEPKLFVFQARAEEEKKWENDVNRSIRVDRSDYVNGVENVTNTYLQERMRESRDPKERLMCEMILKARIYEKRSAPLIEIKGPYYVFRDEKMDPKEVEAINAAIASDRTAALNGSTSQGPDSIYRGLASKTEIPGFYIIQARELLKAREAEGRCVPDQSMSYWVRD